MRGLENITKTKLRGKKRWLHASLALVALVIAVALLVNSAGNTPGEFEAETKKVQKSMQESFVADGSDVTRLANIESTKRAGKDAEALREVNDMLAEPNLSEQDKRTLYFIKGPLCLKIKDLSCVDEFTAEFSKLIPFDTFFMVDAARLAKEQNQPEKAKKYYGQALAEIDKQGGEDYVKKLNESAQATLDYGEIKTGAAN